MHILEKASLSLSHVLEKHPSLSQYTVSEWFCGRVWNQEGGRLINDSVTSALSKTTLKKVQADIKYL